MRSQFAKGPGSNQKELHTQGLPRLRQIEANLIVNAWMPAPPRQNKCTKFCLVACRIEQLMITSVRQVFGGPAAASKLLCYMRQIKLWIGQRQMPTKWMLGKTSFAIK